MTEARQRRSNRQGISYENFESGVATLEPQNVHIVEIEVEVNYESEEQRSYVEHELKFEKWRNAEEKL